MSDNPFQSTHVEDDVNDAVVADPTMDGVVSVLRQTKPWVRFISVMTFLGSGFLLLGGLGIIIGSVLGAVGIPGGIGAILGTIYLAMSLIYIVPGLFLWRYADGITVFVRERSTGSLEAALASQKSFWKFVGIIVLAVMVIYGFAIVLAIAGTSVWSVAGP